jgi:hypothetical protein
MGKAQVTMPRCAVKIDRYVHICTPPHLSCDGTPPLGSCCALNRSVVLSAAHLPSIAPPLVFFNSPLLFRHLYGRSGPA